MVVGYFLAKFYSCFKNKEPSFVVFLLLFRFREGKNGYIKYIKGAEISFLLLLAFHCHRKKIQCGIVLFFKLCCGNSQRNREDCLNLFSLLCFV